VLSASRHHDGDQGVNVMITFSAIFGAFAQFLPILVDFHLFYAIFANSWRSYPIAATNFAFVLKTNVMIIHKHQFDAKSLIISPTFSAIIFNM
jgi:hypothetical protein